MRGRIHFSKGLVPLLLSSLLIIILCLGGCAEDSSILNNGQSRQLEFSVKTCGWNNSNSNLQLKKFPVVPLLLVETHLILPTVLT